MNLQRSLKVAASLIAVVVSLGVLDHFLRWMNQPSDLKLYSGLLRHAQRAGVLADDAFSNLELGQREENVKP